MSLSYVSYVMLSFVVLTASAGAIVMVVMVVLNECGATADVTLGLLSIASTPTLRADLSRLVVGPGNAAAPLGCPVSDVRCPESPKSRISVGYWRLIWDGPIKCARRCVAEISQAPPLNAQLGASAQSSSDNL